MNNDNFYDTIYDNLRKHFSKLDTFIQKYDGLTRAEKEKQNENNKNFENFLKKITNKANLIMKNNFKENIIISLKFQAALLDEAISDYKPPTIKLEINNKDNLRENFNEAKLKLTSIALFFALIEIEENKKNKLKLLVLDDFLTSLDMANRHYIIDYIFKRFDQYQIILLTHNLQFYNLIKSYLSSESNWDFKNIYLRINEKKEEEADIYDEENRYLEQAEEKINNNELPESGNLMRKALEKIMHELLHLKSIGKQESLNTIIDYIKNDEPIYLDQNSLIGDINSKLNNIQNRLKGKKPIDNDIKSIKEKISNNKLNYKNIKAILEQLVFYKDILYNPASHYNPFHEAHSKEYKQSLELIKELAEHLKALKLKK